MKKIKSILLAFLFTVTFSSLLPCTSVSAAGASACIVPQKIADRVIPGTDCGMMLFHDAILVKTANVRPNYTYDVYYKKAGAKKWHKFKTYRMTTDDAKTKYLGHRGEYKRIVGGWFTKTLPNTKYYFKVRTRETGKWSGTEAYWTPCKSTKYRVKGRKVSWNRVKGVSGYVIETYKHVYWDRYDGTPVWVDTDQYETRWLSAGRSSYTLKKGYKVSHIYSYSKHNGIYFVDGAGCYPDDSLLEYDVGYGVSEKNYAERRKKGLMLAVYPGDDSFN